MKIIKPSNQDNTMDEIQEAIAKLRKILEQGPVEDQVEAKSHLDIMEFIDLVVFIEGKFGYDSESAVKLILSYEVYKQIHNG